MANAILSKFGTKTQLTITLDGLANNGARQSTLVDNSSVKAPSAQLMVCLRSGTAPTAGTTYDVYLIRANDATTPNYVSDKGGASDAAITIENAVLLGSVVVTATSNKQFVLDIDTAVVGDLGPAWGIAVKNNATGQSLAAAIAISDATNASPIVLTTATHNMAVGDFVYVTGVTGNTAANGIWRVSAADATHLTLEGSTGNGTYSDSGVDTVSGCHITYITKSPEVQ